ncbi:hypothetical protein LSH36_465g00002 [Paralvinella palmiformis]|uniref:G-protein coupled receptors family 1 profile domain-containing protein n=1 Tax=Paralvinella palmiformis TaxID=53620 RepID=A0AAD9JAD8_9ANNE|nr:hypothetical protein LSH36_465g00002 [Paralvinella palmiformis]
MLPGLSLRGLLDSLNWSRPNATTMVPNGGENSIEMLAELEQFKQYFIPVLVVLGLIGNVASTMALLQRNLKKRPSAHFLAAKCISDTVFLLCLLLLWLQTLGVVLHGSGIWCHFLSMATQASNFQSTWFVVGMAVDRYLVICWPTWTHAHCCSGNKSVADLRHQHTTTVTWARIAVLIVSFVALAVYLNLSLTVGVVTIGGQPTCVPLFHFLKALQVLGYLDMLTNVLLPYTTVIVLISFTTHRVVRFRVSRKRVISRIASSKKTRCHYPKTELRQTKTIVIVCCTQLLCIVPTQVLRIYHTFRNAFGPNIGIQLEQIFLQHVFQLIYFLSFSLNFLLLVASDKVFRKVLHLTYVSLSTKMKLLCRRKNETFPVGAMAFALEFSATLVRMNESALL